LNKESLFAVLDFLYIRPMLSDVRKKARLMRAWTGRHPVWCAWQVTYRCNFRCRFCGYWHDPLGRQPEPTVDDYRIGARKLASFGTMLISLAGGEPLLRHDLPEIVGEIAQVHMPFVTTNGWLATEELADALMSAGLWGVSISIDYADPARHDAARGMDGAWRQAWRAVEIFSRARKYDYQRVNVMSVLLSDNLDQLEPLMQMAADRQAYYMIQPYGVLKTGSKAHIHNNGPVSPKLLGMWERNRNFLSNPRYLSRFDDFLTGGIPGCKAGRAFFNIDSAGDVAICVENKHRPVANLYRDPAHHLRDAIRKHSRNNRCTSCWYNCRGEIESLYHPKSLLMSLPTYVYNHGAADGGKMGRWA
jgi:MoaA/NifB/PqqE/SkfB family radical SAM enzyme